jgi:hypothetical protein
MTLRQFHRQLYRDARLLGDVEAGATAIPAKTGTPTVDNL